MVLGGLAQNIVAIERAQELGCHVTVVDFLHNSPGKKISNESYMISITNVQEIVKLCKRLRIDGVMNYCIDPGQIPYQQICSQLDYPCYGKSNEFRYLRIKKFFTLHASSLALARFRDIKLIIQTIHLTRKIINTP